MKTQYTMMDLFCGTGGFSNGFVNYRNKFKVVYAADIDPIAAATAKSNHHDSEIEVNDLRNVSP